MRIRTPLFILVVAAVSQLGATDCGQVLRDPGFDLWCGDELCAWKVKYGEIRKIPTWHEGDSGVELLGESAIQQLSPVDSGDGQCREQNDGSTQCTRPDNVCIEFSLLAQIEPTASVDLHVDVLDDGTVEHEQRLPSGNWQRIAYRIVVRHPFAGIRFDLVKAGSGTAKLANIGAELADNCDGLPVIDPRPASVGSPCQTGADCESGLCGETKLSSPWTGVAGLLGPNLACLACTPGSCGGGMICGVGAPLSPIKEPPIMCVPAGAKPLGELCVENQECDSGLCDGVVCAACDADADCSGDEKCLEARDPFAGDPFAGLGPRLMMCSPGQGLYASGRACINHSDCASGVCNGPERKQCSDGRTCDSPAQCPFESGLKNGACNSVGISGGTCQ
jgi:hypothetical protein